MVSALSWYAGSWKCVIHQWECVCRMMNQLPLDAWPYHERNVFSQWYLLISFRRYHE